MRRTNCRGCEGGRVDEFLNLGEMPLAGGFLATDEAAAAEKVYPLPVHVCLDCGLVQILEVIDPEIFFQDYSFSSSTVAPLGRHFREYANWLKQQLNPELIVEFGCNDGILLAPLNQLGIRTVGVDVSGNIHPLSQDIFLYRQHEIQCPRCLEHPGVEPVAEREDR